LHSNTTGFANTAFGSGSLSSVTTGNSLTALGSNAGRTLTTGTNTTAIGANAQASGTGATNEFTLGNNVSTLRCHVNTITLISDGRDKTDIKDLNLGLNIIDQVRPVTFRWDKREWYENGIKDGSRADTNIKVGFIAQELLQMMQNNTCEYLELVYNINPEKLEATPLNLFVPLVKAVQELHAKVKLLENKINK